MKTYRQREKQGTKVSDTNKGPDEAKIKVRINLLFRKKVRYIRFREILKHSLVSYFYDHHVPWLNRIFFFFNVFWWPGFAGEDWLHTRCDNRPEKVWWPPTRVCPLRHTATHWYRGKKKNSVVIFVCSIVVGQIHSSFIWSPNDDTCILCSNQLRWQFTAKSWLDTFSAEMASIPDFCPVCQMTLF